MTARELAESIVVLCGSPLMCRMFIDYMVEVGIEEPQTLDQETLRALWGAMPDDFDDFDPGGRAFVWEAILIIATAILKDQQRERERLAAERRTREQQRMLQMQRLADHHRRMPMLPQGAQAALGQLLKSNAHKGGSES